MRIAVWNTAFLGDAVLTLPLLRVLHHVWPEADIDFYVRGGLGALFAAQPELARVIAYDKRGKEKGAAGFKEQVKAARERHYDLWLDAHLSLRSSGMAFLSGAKKRIGYKEAVLSSLVFHHAVPRRFNELEEVERLLALLEPLKAGADGAKITAALADPELTWPVLALAPEAVQEAEKLFSVLPEAPILGLNPGSVWPTKRWTYEGFAAVASKAVEQGANLVLFGAPNEKEEVAAVLSRMGDAAKSAQVLDLSGKTSLPVLAAAIARLSCYLSNDSGPMHLAWAQKIPVTALFGPTVRELGFFPRGEKSRVMEVELPCRPCGLHGHKSCPQQHFRCMKDIDPDLVWQDVRSKLAL